MADTEASDDQRKHKRFRVREGAFVILSPSDAGLGRLIDINIDGLSFDYVTTGEPSAEPTELQILVTDSPFRLYNIPCKTISDFKTFEIPDSPTHRRRSGVQFGKLTESQRSQLEYFIKKYAAEEVAGDETQH